MPAPAGLDVLEVGMLEPAKIEGLLNALRGSANLARTEGRNADAQCFDEAAHMITVLRAARAWLKVDEAAKTGMPMLVAAFHRNPDGSIYQEGAPNVARWLPRPFGHDRYAWVSGRGRLRSEGDFSVTHYLPLDLPHPAEVE